MRIAQLSLLLAASNAFAVSYNLIPNGDFEQGNTSFQSDYTYATGNAYAEGVIKVVSQVSDAHSGIAAQWGNLKGVGGSGNFLFANGSADTTKSPWKVTLNNPSVSLTTDVNSPVYYRFEAMIANTDGPNVAPPSLSFEISVDGGSWYTFVYTPDLRNINQVWTRVYADTYFFTSIPNTLSLRLRNLSSASGGNDFAIDNLYFGVASQSPSFLAGATTYQSTGSINNPTPFNSPSAVPEPSTYGLALGALALAGAVIRRRKA